MEQIEGKNLFCALLERLKTYKQAIDMVEFASPERGKLDKLPETEEELLMAIDTIMESSKELNLIFEHCHDSMFVVDNSGKSIRINRAFELMTNLDRNEIIGKNVANLDAEGTFRPSVCLLALKEKREISVLQEIQDVKGMAVTGTPIFDEKESLFRVVTNAVQSSYVESLTTYIKGKENFSKGRQRAEEKFIAQSNEMKTLLALADAVKNTESSILITGETGVGKGVLAKYIHDTSNRAEKRMVHINCGAIPENLLESELFGYESGAFTGADKKGKQGLIELADGGTILLDEISELPLILQVKLLHFIQSKKMTRVGGMKEINVDARIIAATNRTLEEEVAEGHFRSDLYYRLNVIPFHIPPLRERKKDIKPLAEHFIDCYKKKYNKQFIMDKNLYRELQNKYWPGNIRELENYMERLVVTNQVTEIFEHQGEELMPFSEKENGKRQGREKETKLTHAVDEIERTLIVSAYEMYHSSYKVAEALGISQATAYRKIKKFCCPQNQVKNE